MESVWFCVDEDDSSSHSLVDSDAIDSETEAELYSILHYEGAVSNLNCNTSGIENVKISEVPILTSDRMNDVSCSERNQEYVQTESICSLRPISQNDNNNAEKKQLTNETVFLNKLAQKLNSAKREKYDFDYKISNFLYQDNSEDSSLNQSFQSSFNNKCKRKTDHSSLESSSSMKKNYTHTTDSSDSDSIIWTEADTSDKKEFQINLHKDEDTIFLSSESESDWPPPRNKRDAILKNLSMPDIKIGQNVKDIWFVNDQDLRRSKKNISRRYHDNVEDTCTNCLRKGHNSRICPMPKNIKCFMCGGGHPVSICVNRICSKCFGVGHESRRCWMPCTSYCALCHMRGHVEENCPDLWRRYHLTTHPGKIVRGKRFKQKTFPYCWNCGQGGHFGAECQELRGPKQCLPTWPCVVSYDDPEDLLRKRLNSYSDRSGSFRRIPQINWKNKRNPQISWKNKRNPQTIVANEAGNFRTEKKKKKKKNKLKLQQCIDNKLQQCVNNSKALREKDFPRTPKTRTPKNNNHSNHFDDDMPECLTKILAKRQRRKEKNRKRKLKHRQKFLTQMNASENSLQIDT